MNGTPMTNSITKRALLVGAGAEMQPPFNLPGGNGFVHDTCYTHNAKLYRALDNYYTARLEMEENLSNPRLPRTYQDLFHFSKASPQFKQLIDEARKTDKGDAALFDFLSEAQIQEVLSAPKDESGHRKLPDEVYGELFDLLIMRDTDDQSVKRLIEGTLDELPSNAYFGTIECFFSSLVNPNSRNRSFWKLINYYWSAFFSIARPLIEHAYANDSALQQKGIYEFTLENLADVVSQISERSLFGEKLLGDTYYNALSGYFDYVLTTNYTGLPQLLNPKQEQCIYLSGALWEFESVDSLTVWDIREKEIGRADIVFPYLMTQVPVKPIVDTRQLRKYSRCVNALSDADEVVVLGYSLCENDTHIIALLNDFVVKNEGTVIFLDYDGKMDAGALLSRLRLPSGYEASLSIVPIGDETQVRDLIPNIEQAESRFSHNRRREESGASSSSYFLYTKTK